MLSARVPLAIGLVIFVASGAQCPQVLQQYTQPIPRALTPDAPLDQIVNVVNDHSARVQSISAQRATISTPGMPSISANLAFQRPRSFRLVASSVFGQEVDFGSNDELLWFWIKQMQPPALFYCRHDQFQASAARQVIPFEPEWLVEALGVVTLDPATLEGPFPVGKGRVELRGRGTMSGRSVSKVIIIDQSRGIVLEQHVYDSEHKLLASAVLSKHARDIPSGTTLPRHVQIQCPPYQFELTIDMPQVQVNQLAADPRELFAKPVISGYQEIDLAQPNGMIPPANAGAPPRAAPNVRY